MVMKVVQASQSDSHDTLPAWWFEKIEVAVDDIAGSRHVVLVINHRIVAANATTATVGVAPAVRALASAACAAWRRPR